MPTPAVAPTSSAAMVPKTARVSPVFSPAKIVGRRSGQPQLAEDLPATGTQRLHQAQAVGVDPGQSQHRVDEDGEEADRDRHGHLGDGAVAQPHDEQGCEDDLGQRLERHEVRVEDDPRTRHEREQAAQREADDRPDRESCCDLSDRQPVVREELGRHQESTEGRDDRAGGRVQDRVQQADARHQLPRPETDDEEHHGRPDHRHGALRPTGGMHPGRTDLRLAQRSTPSISRTSKQSSE